MADKNSQNMKSNQAAVQEDGLGEDEETLPMFIAEDVRTLAENNNSPLRRVAEKFQFPLKDEDYKHLALLGLRFENLEDPVGLSLPQLGIHKRAFIFEIRNNSPEAEAEKPLPEGDPTVEEIETIDPKADIDLRKELEKKDPNVIWPKTLWINPSYTIPRDAVLDEDFESCYSLKSEDDFVVGPVFRLNRINYRAYDSQGRIYEGQAEGYAARIIQHEIDHLDGKLYIDYVQPDRVMQLHEYVEKTESGHQFELQKGINPQFEN